MVFAGAALVAPGPAGADSPPPGWAAVDQYREAIPGAVGSIVPGAEPRARPEPLSERVARLVSAEGGSDAPLLRRVATSPTYGAPPRQPGVGASGGEGRPEARTTLSSRSVGSAIIHALAGGGRIGGVAAFMALTALTSVLGGTLGGRATPGRPQRSQG